jgi:sugar porter (SP) family MFS transporter
MAGNPKLNIRYLWVMTFVAAMGGFLFGYDWVVVGGAKNFYEPFFGLTTPSMKGWATSSALLGCIVGALLCFVLSDKFGRKRLLIISGLFFAAAALGTALANNFTEYTLFRILGGIGIGITLNLSPMYISEMSPSHLRGKFVSVNQLMIMIGILAAQTANWKISQFDTEMPANATAEIIRQSWNGQMGWRWMFGLQVIPAMLFFIMMILMPESVRWLVKNGQYAKAHGILAKIGGNDYADMEVLAVKNTIAEDEVHRVNFRDLLEPRLFKILILGVFFAILQQWCGMNVIFYYASDIFRAAGYDILQMMGQIVIIGSVMVVSVIITILVVEKMGRKPLMLLGTGGLALIYIIEGYFFHLEKLGIFIVIMTLASVAVYSLTLAPIVWVILSEIFPNRIRGAAMSITAVALWIGNFSLTFTFPSIKESIGWTMNFWLYAVICITGFIVILVKLPETKGKSLELIEKELIG